MGLVTLEFNGWRAAILKGTDFLFFHIHDGKAYLAYPLFTAVEDGTYERCRICKQEVPKELTELERFRNYANRNK